MGIIFINYDNVLLIDNFSYGDDSDDMNQVIDEVENLSYEFSEE